MDKIAVLIPCYNEGTTIAKVIADFMSALPDAVIYVYDNNSTDDSAAIAETFGRSVIVRHEYKQGKGNVIRRMFREIDAECYIMADGDDTYPAEAAPEMADMVLNYQADMVVGDRLSSTYFEENKRPFHNFGNSLVRTGINRIFRSDIRDIMTGYRAFSYEFVKTFPVLSQGFEIETEMTIHAIDKNMDVRNLIITYRNRPEGSESKLNTYSDGVKVILTIIRLMKNYRPLKFLGAVSALLALISVLLLAPVFADYFRTGLVLRFPTLIAASFVLMTAINLLLHAVAMENECKKSRQQFEIYRNMFSAAKRAGRMTGH